jgi:hypothetical protein
MADTPDTTQQPIPAEEAVARWPKADSERAAETPPQADAEELEESLREGGADSTFLVTDDDDPQAQERKRGPTTPGIG